MTLHDWNFMLIIRKEDNTVEESYHGSGKNAKVEGGKAFYSDETVQTVTVFDTVGTVYLYLVDGRPDKTVDIPAPY